MDMFATPVPPEKFGEVVNKLLGKRDFAFYKLGDVEVSLGRGTSDYTIHLNKLSEDPATRRAYACIAQNGEVTSEKGVTFSPHRILGQLREELEIKSLSESESLQIMKSVFTGKHPLLVRDASTRLRVEVEYPNEAQLLASHVAAGNVDRLLAEDLMLHPLMMKQVIKMLDEEMWQELLRENVQLERSLSETSEETTNEVAEDQANACSSLIYDELQKRVLVALNDFDDYDRLEKERVLRCVPDIDLGVVKLAIGLFNNDSVTTLLTSLQDYESIREQLVVAGFLEKIQQTKKTSTLRF